MIDVRAARAEPDAWRAALARKGAAEAFDAFLAADAEWLALVPRADELRAQTKMKGKPTPEQLEQLQAVKAELGQVEEALTAAAARRDELLTQVPNPPEDSAPDGTTDEDAEEIRRVGEPPQFGFEPRDHLELAPIDMERGARLSGSRFAYRVGEAALLELALYRFALDRVVARGFTPVIPPVLVREEAMYGTGFLPTEEVNIYRVERDELYLTGTSEVALAGFHMGEILEADELPRRYAGYSTCFRREAGAAGKDTRGMFRVHQFDKVEMFVFCRPDASGDEHEGLLAIEEELVGELGLPYRVVNIAAGDLGASATKKYDIEAWFPSQGRYREVTSTSNTTDFQARRLNVRVRGERGVEPAPHAQRDRGHRPPHARRARELPGRGRRRDRPRGARPLRRPGPHRASGRALDSPAGGVPERSKGAVLKTARRREASRGFESHPRRDAPVPKRVGGRMAAEQTLQLTEVDVRPTDIGRFESIAGTERMAHFRAVAEELRRALGGSSVVNVNSTAIGGGVAELLQTLLAYARGAGIDARWLVLSADPAFFVITKRIHNGLYGTPGDGGELGEAERRLYDEVLRQNGDALAAALRPGDVVLLHDPQTAGLAPRLRAAGLPVVWRCHVGLDDANDWTERSWEFLRPYVADVDGYVFSRESFAPAWVDRARLAVIPPSIDPFSPKNQPLEPEEVAAVLAAVGLLEPNSHPPEARFTRRDGSTGRIASRLDLVGEGPLRPGSRSSSRRPAGTR